MEQLNKVELRGTVGSVYIKDFGTTKVANFSVATNHAYKDREGCPVIETTWHKVIAWDNPDTRYAFKLSRGSQVHVIGRLRMQKYIGSDGVERQLMEIIANKVES